MMGAVAHVSLYRKYRPGTFAEVVGQDHVTTTLARAVDAGQWHHAYLFTGPRGTGKTSTARIFAMALNATDGPTSSPPPDDPIVASIRAGNAPDVIEIDAASNNKVEDVRDLVDRVAFTPAIARQKVYIVDECHMLTPQAWNAFLKTIEEPPPHVVFIFATTEPHKVLPTVLSRTQRFDLRRVPAPVLADHCQHIAKLEGFTIDEDALAAIVRAGDGSVRDTLSVLDQVVAYTGPEVTAAGVAEVLGSVPSILLDELAAGLAAGDVAGVLDLVGRVADGGTDLRQFATDSVEHLRSLLLIATAPEAGLVEATPERLDELRAQAARTSTVDLLRAVELLNDAQPKMRRGNTRLPLEIALAKASLPEASGDPAAVAARIDRLEARIAEGVAVSAPGQRSQPSADAPPPEPAPEPAPTAAPEPVAPATPEPTTATPEPVAAAAPEPVAAAAPEPVAAAAGSQLDQVVHAWDAVLETLRQTSRRVEAIIGQGTPIAFQGGVLTLRFPFEFHARQAEDAESSTLIAGILEKIVGSRVTVRAVVGTEDPAPLTVALDDEESSVRDTEEAEAAGELGDAQASHDDAVAALTAGLGAEVIEDTRS